MKKINYKNILKKLNEIQINKDNDKPILIIAEKLENGAYQIIEDLKNYKRNDFTIENKEKFDEYLKRIDNPDCTVIINDMIDQLSDDMTEEVIKQCTTEELKIIVNEFEEIEKELGEIENDKNYDTPKADKIILNGIKNIVNNKK